MRSYKCNSLRNMNRLWTTWRTRIGCFKQIENAISLIIGRLSLVPSNFNNHKLSKYTLETPISLRFEHICHSTWRQCVAALSVFKTTPAMLLKLCRCHKGFFPSSSLKHCQRHNRPRVMVLVMVVVMMNQMSPSHEIYPNISHSL